MSESILTVTALAEQVSNSYVGVPRGILKQLSRSKVRVTCHQNLVISNVDHNTYCYHVMLISNEQLLVFAHTDTRGHTPLKTLPA